MKLGIHVLLVWVCAVLSGAAGAQSPVSDGFSGGPCCSTAAGSLPVFPSMTMPGLGASITDCGLEAQFGTTATFTSSQVLSDYVLVTLTIDAQPAFSITNQILVAKYARTWVELAPSGALLQVWRFLVNGDLVYEEGPEVATGSKIPLSALPPHDLPVHFIGNVDFAKNLSTDAWEAAYTLTHFCPVESHAAFSQRPIAGAAQWANRSYHFVGPANFVFDPFPWLGSPSGPIIGESSRRSSGLATAGPYTSFGETGIHRGLVYDISLDCVGGAGSTTSTAARYAHQGIGACSEFCGTANAPISSVPTGLPTLPTGLRGLSIGKYVAQPGSQYPGDDEYISVYLGLLDSAGLCSTAGAPSLHAVSGVGTGGGNPVLPTQEFFPLTWKAIDLHDMNVITPFGFVPGFGSVFASERVWSFTLL